MEDPFNILPGDHPFNAVLRRVRELGLTATTPERRDSLRIALGVAQAALDAHRRQHRRGRPPELITDPVASAIDDAREMLNRAATGTTTADFSRLPTATPESARYRDAYEGELARLSPVVENALSGALKDARWSQR
jgi:hypothetical protein